MSRSVIRAACALLLFAPSVSFAQDLVYKPLNPAFGGDTFNYQWLLSSAQAQNKLDDQGKLAGGDPLGDFEANLNRQILNQLSREIIAEIFGEDSLQDGSFEFGTLQVNIASEIDGINIDIVNTRDGSRTNIIVPYY